MLVSFGGQTITYDEIGNPIVYRDGMNFSWTGRQLDTVTIDNTTNISYTYDVDGIRTKKVVDGVTTEYFVNGSTILAQKTGNDIIWFIYDVDGEILGFTYNDTPYYYIKNLQGDVVVIVNSAGLPMASYTYDPWGKITSSTGTMADINPIRYRGYYYDSETGLYYLNSRYYDPDTCRFVNADAYVTTGQGLLSYNMFAYCLNNPVNYIDSFGTDAIWIHESESAAGFGHAGLLVQDNNGTWNFFYWGPYDEEACVLSLLFGVESACIVEPLNVGDANLHNLSEVVNVIAMSDVPEVSNRASKIDDMLYLEGGYFPTYLLIMMLKEESSNTLYYLLHKNCVQQVWLALGASNGAFRNYDNSFVRPNVAFEKAHKFVVIEYIRTSCNQLVNNCWKLGVL